MYPTLNLIRRVAHRAGQLTRLFNFDFALEVDLDEAEMLEELQAKGFAGWR